MKNVLVTAGAAGIGKKIAERFADKGCNIWVCDINESTLDEVPQNWKTSLLDVSDEIKVKSLFEKITSEWGTLDTVCCNAGNAGPTNLTEKIELSDWKNCLAVNLEGAFLTSKYAIPLMKKRLAGSILFTSSTAGIYGYPNRAPYSAAKWAIIGMTKYLGVYFAQKNIRVNALSPTGVYNNHPEEFVKKLSNIIPMGRMADINEYKGAIVFMCSDASSYMTGENVVIDGGKSVW